MIPQDHAVTAIGQHVLFGWSNTDEAARSVHDALMLTKPNAQIDILYVGQDHQDSAPDTSARRDLAPRHGIKTVLISQLDDPDGIAAILLRQAFEQGCDMIVTGAFGHSRTYDFVVGTVTHDRIKKQTCQCLLQNDKSTASLCTSDETLKAWKWSNRRARQSIG